MKRKKLQEILISLENFYWDIRFAQQMICRDPMIKLLKSNEKYKNIYNNKTCFILGNGPSLKYEKHMDKLQDYTVFSVNQFYRSNLFKVVKPKYHVMVDPLFFNLHENDPDEAETLLKMREISSDPNIHMIFPVDFYKYIKKHIGNEDKHIYIKERYRVGETYNKGYDMSKFLPVACNVVLTAIYCAIFMGFKRIIILGCEMTGLLDNYIKRSLNSETEKFTHVYEYTEAERRRMQRVHSMHSNERMLLGFTTMFHDFRIVNNQCIKMDIKLLNASQETALDMIPFTTLDYELTRNTN